MREDRYAERRAAMDEALTEHAIKRLKWTLLIIFIVLFSLALAHLSALAVCHDRKRQTEDWATAKIRNPAQHHIDWCRFFGVNVE